MDSLKKRIKSHAAKDTDIHEAIQLCLHDNYCAICHKINMIDIHGNLTPDAVVDHYHRDSNGKGPIRGLLCKSCNVLEGKIRKMVTVDYIPYDVLCEKYGNHMIQYIDCLYLRGGGILPMDTESKVQVEYIEYIEYMDID